jgi:protein CpxP
MKNLLMIAIAFLTISATAQERKKDGQKGDSKEHMDMRKDMTPEENAQLQTKKMTLELDLTEKQQVEVEKVLLAEAKTRKAKMEEFKAKKDKAESEKPSKEDRLKMANERLDYQIEHKKKIKAILNAEQYAKFEKMQEERQEKRGNGAKMRMHKD